MGAYSTVEEVLNAVWGIVEFSGLEECPTVNSVGIFGNTPLSPVITWGDLEAVKILIENGANINIQMEDGNTPLHYAISMGEFGIARCLVELGAKQNIKNNEGKLPKDLCWEGEWDGIFGNRRA